MTTGLSSFRPAITGTSHMVSSGHWLATAAGYRILEEGGNAIDAGVAAGIVLGDRAAPLGQLWRCGAYDHTPRRP